MSDHKIAAKQSLIEETALSAEATMGATVSLRSLFTFLFVPIGLLTTNLTFGLPVAETMPVLFVVMGMALLALKRQLVGWFFCVVPAVILVYGLFGVLGKAPTDGLRIVAAAVVFFIALQLGVEGRILGKACRVALYTLFVLRVLAIFFPEQMSDLYDALGLRAARLYGGGVAILFAEPSYLASATFSMWAVAKCAEQSARCQLMFVDVCAISILLLSGSASAALYALIGLVILLRHRPMVILGGLALGAAGFGILLALEGNRVGVFANAAVAMVNYGDLETAMSAFVAVDPSASFRLAMTVLSITAAFRAPMGHFELEMSRDIAATAATDKLGLFSGNELLESLMGNLQANTVPLQFLYFGGWPLFAVICAAITIAISRLISNRQFDGAYLLMIAALLGGCFLQSVLTSPFFYLCIAFALQRQKRLH